GKMLSLYQGFYCHAGRRLQPGRAERPAGEIRGVSGDGDCQGILRRGKIRKEYYRETGVSEDAAGRGGWPGRGKLYPGVQTVQVWQECGGCAEFPAVYPGLRRKPDLCGRRD